MAKEQMTDDQVARFLDRFEVGGDTTPSNQVTGRGRGGNRRNNRERQPRAGRPSRIVDEHTLALDALQRSRRKERWVKEPDTERADGKKQLDPNDGTRMSATVDTESLIELSLRLCLFTAEAKEEVRDGLVYAATHAAGKAQRVIRPKDLPPAHQIADASHAPNVWQGFKPRAITSAEWASTSDKQHARLKFTREGKNEWRVMYEGTAFMHNRAYMLALIEFAEDGVTLERTPYQRRLRKFLTNCYNHTCSAKNFDLAEKIDDVVEQLQRCQEAIKTRPGGREAWNQ